MDKKRLKILEITAFSAGFCGVWTRVLAESNLLARKHDVYVFSSNVSRGTDKECASSHEKIGNVKISRFPAKFNFGQNTYFWNFDKQALKLKPDIIISHAYRQYYSTHALKIARKLRIPCFLVTHAPFLDKKLRNWKLNLAVFFYDNFIGKRIINKYKKIISITNWEIPYLLELGAKKSNIVHIPNGIPEEFFKIKKTIEHHVIKGEVCKAPLFLGCSEIRKSVRISDIKIKKPGNKIRKILFLGRIAPIKDIETLIKAFNLVLSKRKDVQLDLVGPVEEDYKEIINSLIKKLQIKINFLGPVYDLKEKIKILDSADVFVLPSRREGMPQALIEAMSRKKIVISSRTDGGKEIIQDGKNGFLFDIGSEKQLAEKLLFSLDDKNKVMLKKIEENALRSVKQFSWNNLIKKIEKIYLQK